VDGVATVDERMLILLNLENLVGRDLQLAMDSSNSTNPQLQPQRAVAA
jgi:hypothetical protein